MNDNVYCVLNVNFLLLIFLHSAEFWNKREKNVHMYCKGEITTRTFLKLLSFSLVPLHLVTLCVCLCTMYLMSAVPEDSS